MLYSNATIWEKKTQLESWLYNIDIKSLDFIRLASSFGVGFLCGLLVKRCLKYIILLGVFFVIIFALLQYFSIIMINYVKIQKITGLKDITHLSQLLFFVLIESKKHIVELSCSSIGFFLGLKTG